MLELRVPTSEQAAGPGPTDRLAILNVVQDYADSLDFDGALARLVELVGAMVDVRISGADGRPELVANFGGLLLGGDQLDKEAAATGEEELMFDLEDPDGTQHYGMFVVRRSDFDGAALEGGLVLHLRLGTVSVRIMPERR